jgi:hypothetical protein
MKKDSFPLNWLVEIIKKFIWLIKMFPCKVSSSVGVSHHFFTVILGKSTYIVLFCFFFLCLQFTGVKESDGL